MELLFWVVVGNGGSVVSPVSCLSSSSNGWPPEPVEDGVKEVELLIEEKRRVELSAQIASGTFTVDRPR